MVAALGAVLGASTGGTTIPSPLSTRTDTLAARSDRGAMHTTASAATRNGRCGASTRTKGGGGGGGGASGASGSVSADSQVAASGSLPGGVPGGDAASVDGAGASSSGGHRSHRQRT